MSTCMRCLHSEADHDGSDTGARWCRLGICPCPNYLAPKKAPAPSTGLLSKLEERLDAIEKRVDEHVADGDRHVYPPGPSLPIEDVVDLGEELTGTAEFLALRSRAEAAEKRAGEAEAKLAVESERVIELEGELMDFREFLADVGDELEGLRARELRWARWIVSHVKDPRDHGCARCVPDSDVLKPGFVCTWHAAEDVVRAFEARGES